MTSFANSAIQCCPTHGLRQHINTGTLDATSSGLLEQLEHHWSLLARTGAIPRQMHTTDALDQWCLWKLLGIKWYHHVHNDEVRWTTGQPHLSAIVQARRFSLFGHRARIQKKRWQEDLNSCPSENRRPPGWPRTTWMKTTEQSSKSNNQEKIEYQPSLAGVKAGCAARLCRAASKTVRRHTSVTPCSSEMACPW